MNGPCASAGTAQRRTVVPPTISVRLTDTTTAPPSTAGMPCPSARSEIQDRYALACLLDDLEATALQLAARGGRDRSGQPQLNLAGGAFLEGRRRLVHALGPRQV